MKVEIGKTTNRSVNGKWKKWKWDWNLEKVEVEIDSKIFTKFSIILIVRKNYNSFHTFERMLIFNNNNLFE